MLSSHLPGNRMPPQRRAQPDDRRPARYRRQMRRGRKGTQAMSGRWALAGAVRAAVAPFVQRPSTMLGQIRRIMLAFSVIWLAVTIPTVDLKNLSAPVLWRVVPALLAVLVCSTVGYVR